MIVYSRTPLKKVRGFVRSQNTGLPVSGITVALKCEYEGQAVRGGFAASGGAGPPQQFTIATLCSDRAGYFSFDISALPLDVATDTAGSSGQPRVIRLWVACTSGQPAERPIFDRTRNITFASLLTAKSPVLFDFLVPNDPPGSTCRACLSIQTPDLTDWDFSPNSFVTRSRCQDGGETSDGDGTCAPMTPSSAPTHEYFFHKVTGDFSSPVTSAPLGLFAGSVKEYRQSWLPLGHALGDVLYSLTLAPCESVNLVVTEWQREDLARRSDQIDVSESLVHQLQRDRTVEEVVQATLQEQQSGWSVAGGVGAAYRSGGTASGTVPADTPIDVSAQGGIGLMGGLGAGYASTSGRRTLTGSDVQTLADSILQKSNSIRQLRSTVIVQATQKESDRIQTRRVTNHNHCHALNVEYYEIIRHYKVVTEYAGTRDIVFVPFNIYTFDENLLQQFGYVFAATLLEPALANCLASVVGRCKGGVVGAGAGSSPPVPGAGPSREGLEFVTSLTVSIAVGGQGVIGSTSGKDLVFSFDLNVNSVVLTGGSYNLDGLELDANATYKKTFSVTDIGSGGVYREHFRQVTLTSNMLQSWTITDIRVEWLAQSGHAGLLLEKTFTTPQTMSTGSSWTDTALPPAPAPPPASSSSSGPTEEQLAYDCCVKQLIDHFNAHQTYYSKALWVYEDPDDRARYFSQLTYKGKPLLNVVENTPIAIVGNNVAFPLIGETAVAENLEQEIRIIGLPTRGVFGETMLSNCNACEKRDVTRFWDWTESPCPEQPPTIEGVRPGPFGQPATVAQGTMPSPVVQITNPPPVPDPTGLAAAFTLLGRSDLFRDMSGLKEVSKLVSGLTSGAMDLAEAKQQAATVQRTLSNAGTTGSSGAGRSMSPAQRYDNLQVARQAAETATSLGLPVDAKQRAFESILGTDATSNIVEPAVASSGIVDARYWVDLITFKPQDSVIKDATARGLEWQKIDDAYGDVNLDFYMLEIERLPNDPLTGAPFTEEAFVEHIRRNLASFLITYPGIAGPSMIPFEAADDAKWLSTDPVGAVMEFQIDARPFAEAIPWGPPLGGFPIPELGLVVCAEHVLDATAGDWRWKFVTVKGSGFVGYHPVSGIREFGARRTDRSLVFLVRAADRATTILEYALSPLFLFRGAEAYWDGFFNNLLSFVKSNGGDASMGPVYSNRLDWRRVKDVLFGGTIPA